MTWELLEHWGEKWDVVDTFDDEADAYYALDDFWNYYREDEVPNDDVQLLVVKTGGALTLHEQLALASSLQSLTMSPRCGSCPTSM